MSTYINGPYGRTGGSPPHDWEEHTYDRLEWIYGEARAHNIMSRNDPRTLADVARWNALGRRSAA